MNTTIGEKIEQVATVVESGSSLVGMMGFDTPFLKLRLSDGRVVKWQSDKVGMVRVREGGVVFLTAYLYANLRRVNVVVIKQNN